MANLRLQWCWGYFLKGDVASFSAREKLDLETLACQDVCLIWTRWVSGESRLAYGVLLNIKAFMNLGAGDFAAMPGIPSVVMSAEALSKGLLASKQK